MPRPIAPVAVWYRQAWDEWMPEAGGSQRMRLRPTIDQPWAFAALWERAAKGSDLVGQVVILTTAADATIAHVHERMPVVVPLAAAADWFRGEDVRSAVPFAYSAKPVSSPR